VAARVVLTCWGSFGDLFPTLGLARELQRRGHHPVVATCPFYRDIVQAQHLDFAPVRPDLDPDDTALIARVMDPKQGTEVILREMLVPYVREAYEDTEAAAAGADLIVSHPVTFAARMVAERLGLPWLSTALAPTSFFSLHDFPLLPPYPRVMRLARVSPWVARGFMAMARSVTRFWLEPVVEFRASLGLPPAGDPLYEGQFSPLGTLALFSRVMAEPQPDWPVRTTVCGFVFHDTFGEMPPALAAFLDAGDPPVVFTLCTSAVGAPGAFYRESARAASMYSMRLIESIWPRTIRAIVSHSTAPMAMKSR